MSDDTADIAALLCSRLCHDLLSPVGAMMNGLELLADEDDPEMRARCLDLLGESARTTADKLKFFRLAFGSAGGFGEAIAAEEVRSAIAGLVRANPRVELVWMVEQPAIAKNVARVLLNLAMIGLDALIRGGRLMVAGDDGEVVVRAEGARIVLDGAIRAMLAGEVEEPDARTSAAWLARRSAAADGRRIRLAEEEGVLLLAATAG
jgi:histidine phosphotransferase ChpT